MKREEFEALGDKHKKYESLNQQNFIPGLPIMLRVDGRAFHTFAKGLAKPFDRALTTCMQEMTKTVLHETNALIGYTQSDEASFILPASENYMLFGGRKQKIESVVASIASVAFYKAILQHLPQKADCSPVFDCRAWQYPTKELCVESLLWRETDATRNSLNMACSSVYTQKELQNVGRSKLHDMLMEKGINWNDYAADFKRGYYFVKRSFKESLTSEELCNIPEKYRPVDGMVERSKITPLELPPISTVTNMISVVFDQEEVKTA